MRAKSEQVNYQCHREQCIARARNVVLDWYYHDPEYAGFNYFLFVDCDFQGGITSDAILTSFLRNDWDIACSNGEGRRGGERDKT